MTPLEMLPIEIDLEGTPQYCSIELMSGSATLGYIYGADGLEDNYDEDTTADDVDKERRDLAAYIVNATNNHEWLTALNATLVERLRITTEALNKAPIKDSALRFQAGALVAENLLLLAEHAQTARGETAKETAHAIS